jgi:hypothetical protein
MTTTRWPEAAWHYQDETLRHELTVMHDDGNYRNLMFRNPASSFYWFSLATWPGHLAFTGDVGSWLFRRATDMFGFFTGTVPANTVASFSDLGTFNQCRRRWWLADLPPPAPHR